MPKTDQHPTEYLTTKQVAQTLLRCDVRTVHRMVASGRLTPADQRLPWPTAPYLFDRRDVEALLAPVEPNSDEAA